MSPRPYSRRSESRLRQQGREPRLLLKRDLSLQCLEGGQREGTACSCCEPPLSGSKRTARRPSLESSAPQNQTEVAAPDVDFVIPLAEQQCAQLRREAREGGAPPKPVTVEYTPVSRPESRGALTDLDKRQHTTGDDAT